MPAPLHISAAFDSGNIEVVDPSDPGSVRLRIGDDVGGEHRQWFHFSVAGLAGRTVVLHIENAGQCSYPKGWQGYRACASTDRQTWRRVPTGYVDGVLTITVAPSELGDADVVWLAYFAPFSRERHLDLVARCQQSPLAQVDVVGRSVDGRALERVRVGEAGPVLWVIARQHPGESMAEWWMEGFLGRLLDPDDALARRLRERAQLHVVPNMNPDGSVRGHLRCNAAGANLNREWHAPTDERSPEVLAVREAMDRTGVDLCLDVHGDEALPYNFIAGAEGIVGWTERQASLQSRFTVAYEKACPDFQTVHGYPRTPPGKANMSMCTNQVAARFDCLAMTLEMPFKDNADAPDAAHGWSPERARGLGRAAVFAMGELVGSLR
jgi:murein tripeptide amidase MpaA